MTNRSSLRMVRPSALTWIAIGATLLTIAVCVAFLIACYSSLPDILPVRFNRVNRPIGWQYKSYARVLMPVLVQATLALIFGGVGALLLSRSHGAGEEDAPISSPRRRPPRPSRSSRSCGSRFRRTRRGRW